MSCICEGNRALRNLEHMRELARKAAALDGCDYVLYSFGGLYQFCREEEYTGSQEKIIERIKA